VRQDASDRPFHLGSAGSRDVAPGFCMLSFATPEEATAALAMDGVAWPEWNVVLSVRPALRKVRHAGGCSVTSIQT